MLTVNIKPRGNIKLLKTKYENVMAYSKGIVNHTIFLSNGQKVQFPVELFDVSE